MNRDPKIGELVCGGTDYASVGNVTKVAGRFAVVKCRDGKTRRFKTDNLSLWLDVRVVDNREAVGPGGWLLDTEEE